MNTESDILLPLYRAARSQPTLAFQDLALRLIQPLIRFESAVWAMGYRSGSPDRPALVPILALSHTQATDPAGVAEWRQINRADKAIPIMLASPYTTCQIHSPTLFENAEDIAMRDYTRRFGRQCALVTGLGTPSSPMVEWSVLYRPDGDDHFSAAEQALCQRLMLHMSEALRVNRIVRRASADCSDTDDTASDTAALINRRGEVLAAGAVFIACCRHEWAQFDPARLPPHVVQHIVGAGQAQFSGSRLQLRARPLADLWWVTATQTQRLPGRRMNVAALFAQGHSHKAIARLLGISPTTARNHLAASYRDLGVTNRGELQRKLNVRSTPGS